MPLLPHPPSSPQVRIVRDPSGKSRGFGFVAMETEDDVRNVGGWAVCGVWACGAWCGLLMCGVFFVAVFAAVDVSGGGGCVWGGACQPSVSTVCARLCV